MEKVIRNESSRVQDAFTSFSSFDVYSKFHPNTSHSFIQSKNVHSSDHGKTKVRMGYDFPQQIKAWCLV